MNLHSGFRSAAMAMTAVAALTLGAADRAEAVQISGSLPLVVLSAAQNGANLSVSTLLTGADISTSGAGTGDYLPIPSLTSFGPFSLDLTDLGTFSISNASFGSFASVAAGSFIVSQSPNFLDVFLLGTYTPGPGLAAGLDPTATSLRISFNQSGESLSGAVTLNTPPVPPQVPAPATLALFGAALAGLAIARRRKD